MAVSGDPSPLTDALIGLQCERDQATACWKNYREYALEMANIIDRMRADGFLPMSESDVVATELAAATNHMTREAMVLKGLLEEVCDDSTASLTDPDKRLWPIRSSLHRRIRAAIGNPNYCRCSECGHEWTHVDGVPDLCPNGPDCGKAD